MSFYNASGQINLTSVSGSSFTGLYAADGSWNIVLNDGSSPKGYYHPCGAINAVLVSGATSYYNSNGSLNVVANSSGGYSPALPSLQTFLLGADSANLLGADSALLLARS